MTLAAERWPAYAGPAASERRSSAWVVYRTEPRKISRLIQVRTIAVLAVIGPFLAVAVLHVQSATPGDTAFGQWVHSSGLAIPLVVLGFGAAWVGPVLTAVVAGDIFSSEDRFGTWKTILPRSSRAFPAPAWPACTPVPAASAARPPPPRTAQETGCA